MDLAYQRPLFSLVVAALLPAALGWLLGRMLGEGEEAERQLARAFDAYRVIHIGIAWTLGATALGPDLAEARYGLPAALFGLFTAAVGFGGTLLWENRVRPSSSEDNSRESNKKRTITQISTYLLFVPGFPIAAALALFLPFEPRWAVAASIWLGLLGISLLLTPKAGRLREGRPTLAGGAPTGTFSGLASGVLVLALLTFAVSTTEIPLASAETASAERARWRLRVDPWDERAILASAWAARAEERYPLAIERAERAVALGIPRSRLLEIRSEVAAAQGECDEARRYFDESIAARAEERFAREGLSTPLTLGGYRLPPALVRSCTDPTPTLHLDLDLGEEGEGLELDLGHEE